MTQVEVNAMPIMLLILAIGSFSVGAVAIWTDHKSEMAKIAAGLEQRRDEHGRVIWVKQESK